MIRNLWAVSSEYMIFFYLPIYLSIYLPIYLPIHLSTHLPTCLSIYLSIFLPIYLPAYLSTYPSIYPSTYLPIYLSTHLHLYKVSMNPCFSIHQVIQFVTFWSPIVGGHQQLWKGHLTIPKRSQRITWKIFMFKQFQVNLCILGICGYLPIYLYLTVKIKPCFSI